MLYRSTVLSFSRFPKLLLLLSLTLVLAGCDQLLEVEPDTDTVPGDQINNPTSLDARLVGAEADFFFAYDMAIVWGGLYTDELIDATGFDEVDERRVQPDQGTIGAVDEAPEGIDGLWTPMQRAVAMADLMQDDILADNFPEQIPSPDDSPELARMSLFAGYSKLILADLFCSLAFGGTGPELTPAETYQQVVDEFTFAINAAGADSDVRNAAYVGRARAHLQLGNSSEALSDAQQVDPDFTFMANAYSTNSSREENDLWNMLTDSQRFSVGPPFRNMTIDGTGTPDPRVDVFQDPDDQFAVDGSTPLYQARKYVTPTAPIRLASAVEAQYIIAEIEGGQAAVGIINDIRSEQGITETFASNDEDEILNKVIDERSRTLFLEGQRMGDLRRYLDRYGIDLFPTGPGFEDGTCFPLPNAERDNNPDI